MFTGKRSVFKIQLDKSKILRAHLLHQPNRFTLQVWISYAKFELSIDSPERLQKCRQIYEEANKSMRSCEEKEERLMLLESWRDFENEFGSDSTSERVRKLLPDKVKKRRKLTAEDGVRIQSAGNGVKFFIIQVNFL